MQKVLKVACPHCQAINSVSSEPVVGGQLCAQCHKEIFDGEVLELTTEMFVQHIVNSDLPVLVDYLVQSKPFNTLSCKFVYVPSGEVHISVSRLCSH